MDDDFDELVVSVRADTGGFARDIQAMKSEFDTSLLGGFDAAGKVLERSLANALRTGKFEFEDLKRVALSVLDQIAARLLESGFDAMFGGSSKGGFDLSSLGDMLGSMFGLPGRATGESWLPTGLSLWASAGRKSSCRQAPVMSSRTTGWAGRATTCA